MSGDDTHREANTESRKGAQSRRPRAAGIRQVAREAGVSVASVSRTLNRPHSVSLAIRRKVEEAIERLGYVPNPAARSLSLRRSHSIGAVVPTLDYSIFARFIEALQRRANEVGYNVILSTSGFDPQQELEQARGLIAHGVEALMLSGESHSPALHQLLLERSIPYLHTSVFNPESPHPCVGYDNLGAAKEATEHLLELGHRRFGAIIGPRATNDRMALRVSGIREALAAQGLALAEKSIIEKPYSIAQARVGFRELLRQRPDVTGVLCGNDVLAFGVILEAQAAGVRVPQDLSVIGFDNLEWAAEIVPALTTVKIPTGEMGVAAANYLINRITGKPALLHTELELTLIIRESSGPAPATR